MMIKCYVYFHFKTNINHLHAEKSIEIISSELSKFV